MNSIHMLRKTIFVNSFRLTRLHVNKYEHRVQNLCSVPNFKIDRDSATENQRSDFSHNLVDADTFGLLKTPLENSSKNLKPRTVPTKTENKKIIKTKKAKKDSDTFGNLSENKPIWYPDINEESKSDNDLSDNSVYIRSLKRGARCPEKYLQEMKKLVGEKKVKEALNLFVDMRKNFVDPILPHFTYMIGVCGRVGYTEMAFDLLRQLTDRRLRPTPATLTGLFNACAESPFPEYGLRKARALKEKIEVKNWMVTKITYHAMIKAFGKCGDLVTAFKIVDEMAKADIKIDVKTYSFLLTSCITNKEAGFTYAVEVWRMMKAKKCSPNVYTFNLLLRATRDCDVGPEDISCLLLQHWSSYTKRPYGFITKESLSKEKEHIMRLNSGSADSTGECLKAENKNHTIEEKLDHSFHAEDAPKYEIKNVSSSDIINSQNSVATSVLSTRPLNGPEILEILNIKSPSDRLSLLGGMEGFLKLMFESKVMPERKTFNLLLQVIPDNIQEEEKLLTFLDKYEIKPDIVFFNFLIKRRVFRRDDQAAKDVLHLINKYDLTPDIMTFGALALACRNLKQASTFFSEMEKMGSYPNIEIAGCMVKRACMILDFSFVKYVLEVMEKYQIKPTERFLKMLEEYLSEIKKNIILLDHGKEVNEFYKMKGLKDDFKKFYVFYEGWLKRMKFQPEDHPWLQYKTDIIVRAEEEKLNL